MRIKGTTVMTTSTFYSALPAQSASTQTSSKNSKIICLKTQRLRIFGNIGINSSLLIAQLPKIMISVDVLSQMTLPLSQALTTDGLFFVQLNTLISTANWKKLNYLKNVRLQLKIKILLQLISLLRKSAPTHLLEKEVRSQPTKIAAK